MCYGTAKKKKKETKDCNRLHRIAPFTKQRLWNIIFFLQRRLLLLTTSFCNVDMNLHFLTKICLTNLSFFMVFTHHQQFLPNFKRQEEACDQGFTFLIALEILSQYTDQQNRWNALNIGESCFQR